MSEPTIDVYLVHYCAPDTLRASLSSLQRSIACRPKIRVVDNGGLGAAAVPPDVPVLSAGSNRGFSGGANIALRDWLVNTSAPYVVIGCHDVLVEKDTLATMVRVAASHPNVGIVGPEMHQKGRVEGGPVISAGDLVEREWLTGALLLLRREMVLQVGGFDEAFGSYVEDVDYCHRARAANWAVAMVPSVRASGTGSYGGDPQRVIAVNTVRLARKEHGRSRALLRGARFWASAVKCCALMLLPDSARPSGRRYLARWSVGALAGGMHALPLVFGSLDVQQARF